MPVLREGYRQEQYEIPVIKRKLPKKRKTALPKCGNKYHLGNPKGKTIAFQAELENVPYEIVIIDNLDDLNACYQRLLELAERIEERREHCQVIANYTGGTSTMSAAIALAGIMTPQVGYFAKYRSS